MNKNIKRAFSLIELSVVILIIGILVAGVTQSSRLIRQFRISAAQSITKSSPVSSIKNLSFWLETTLVESFDEAEVEDNFPITNWKDISPTSTNKVSALAHATDAAQRPTYIADCFKSLPCLNFDGNDFLNLTKSLVYGDFTLFVVVDIGTEGETGYVLHTIYTNLTNEGRIYLLLTGNTSLQFSFRYVGSSANNTALVNIPANSIVPYIFEAYENDVRVSFSLNGAEVGSNTANVSPSGVRNTQGFTIGAFGGAGGSPSNFFSGRVAEIIFFDRSLKSEEKNEIRDYLNKKWK